ncbi:MAG: hypothetical protein WCX69_05630 [Candidatus Paceibacterota bacterium]
MRKKRQLQEEPIIAEKNIDTETTHYPHIEVVCRPGGFVLWFIGTDGLLREKVEDVVFQKGKEIRAYPDGEIAIDFQALLFARSLLERIDGIPFITIRRDSIVVAAESDYEDLMLKILLKHFSCPTYKRGIQAGRSLTLIDCRIIGF